MNLGERKRLTQMPECIDAFGIKDIFIEASFFELTQKSNGQKNEHMMIILCNLCHKIHSSLHENCKDKLFNVKTRVKEKKLRIAFSSQSKSTDKTQFDSFLKLALMGLKKIRN